MHLSEVQQLYKRVEENNKGQKASLWLNLGLWTNTNKVEEACVALFEKTIEGLKFQEGAKVLDAGFGFGIQDVNLAKKHENIHITGINVVDFQISFAQQLIKDNGLEERVLLLNEDATDTSLNGNQFDAVIAIESAFHFNTREAFFNEAYRLLKPGGMIALADCLPLEQAEFDDQFKAAANEMAIPIENCYDINTYQKKMTEVGFTNLKVEDITDEVLPMASLEMFDADGWRTADIIQNQVEPKSMSMNDLLSKFIQVTTIGKYYIISAKK